MTTTETASKIAFTVEVPIPLDFLSDILCTAFEGGINYWCSEATLVKGTHPSDIMDDDYFVPNGFCYEMRDGESGRRFSRLKAEYPNYVPLTLKSLRKGLALYFLRGNPHGEILDAGNYDAAEADIVVQFSVFGEVIFG